MDQTPRRTASGIGLRLAGPKGLLASASFQPAARNFSQRNRGFSLVELLLVMAILATVGAMAIPAITNMLGEMRVGAATRQVERELQTARLRAVSTNRPMRVRFNCPTAGQYRLVELIGTPTAPANDDTDGRAAARCSTANYPYPDLNRGVFDIPNNDGELKMLDPAVQFVDVTTIEFWPDGTARTNQGRLPWDPIPTNSPVSITLQKATGSSAAQLASKQTIQVNGLGKVQIQ